MTPLAKRKENGQKFVSGISLQKLWQNSKCQKINDIREKSFAAK